MLYVRVAKAHLDRWLATPMGLGEYHGPLNHQNWLFMWRHLMKTTLSLLLWILDDSAIMVMDISGIFLEICQEWRIMMYMILSTSMIIHGCLSCLFFMFDTFWTKTGRGAKQCQSVKLEEKHADSRIVGLDIYWVGNQRYNTLCTWNKEILHESRLISFV